ncbi:MAG: FKBP-type peptidyl-prolyl cis-trans isomerase [Spirosoma sp.]|nr:FKBP-type peptidyl-prolyl cis-trans isomerase [Spirosoma sp.]
MKFSRLFLAGLVSAVFTTGFAVAQTKKPAARPIPKPAARPLAKPAPVAGTISSPQDSISYSIGLFMAQSLKQNGMTDLNSALVTQGLQDAMKGGSTRLSMEQASTIMNAYQQKQFAVKNAESMKESAENKKIGDEFLTANKAKAGVTTTASGLQYSIEKEGTGPKPTSTDRVKVHYAGKLLDGTEFDSSVKRGQPAEFGVTQVIKGWTEALQLMPVGSKWKLYIPSDLAYGDRGAGADIKPGSTLVFDVELLDIVK